MAAVRPVARLHLYIYRGFFIRQPARQAAAGRRGRAGAGWPLGRGGGGGGGVRTAEARSATRR